MRQHIICGIDVGNVAVKTIIAEQIRGSARPRIIGVGRSFSNGLRRGVPIDMSELMNNIRESLDKAERMAAIKVQRAYVSISGLHIAHQMSRGVIIVSRADNEISGHDIERAIEAASTISLPPNREIIHRIPRAYVIDGQEVVKNALGMRGVRLEAEVMLIEGLSPYIGNIAKGINANEVEVAEFVFAPLATARAVLDKFQREQGALTIDFGGGTSNIALYNEGELVHTAVFPVGSKHITNDLAVAFRIPVEQAELIKCMHGSIVHDDNNKEMVDLSDIVGEDNFIIPRKQITKIISARVSELFDMIGNELKKISMNRILPAGVTISGGGAHLNGLIAYARDKLGLAVKIPNKYSIDGAEHISNDPAFAAVIGLTLWGFDQEYSSESPMWGRFTDSIHKGKAKKITKWFKNFLP